MSLQELFYETVCSEDALHYLPMQHIDIFRSRTFQKQKFALFKFFKEFAFKGMLYVSKNVAKL